MRNVARIIWIAVFCSIFLLGLAMRSPEILAKNYLFLFDQGQNYISAYNIAVNHKFTLIGAEAGSGSAGVPGLFHGPGFYYLLAMMMVLFGTDPYWGLVLMWIGGVTTLLLVYLTTRKMFGNHTALLALFLVSIAPLIAPQSRFVWGPHFGSVLIVLFYFLLYKIVDRPQLYAPLAVFTAGLMYHFELALAIPLVLTAFVSLVVYRLFSVKTIVLCILAASLAFAPAILFEVRHGFMATNGIIKNITTKRIQTEVTDQGEQKKDEGFFLPQKKQAFIAGFTDSFVFEYGKIPPAQYSQALLCITLTILLGFFAIKDPRIRRYGIALFLTVPISFLVFLPLRNQVWPYFLVHLYFVYIYLFAVASVAVFSKIHTSVIYIPASAFVIFFLLSMTQGVGARLDLNWRVDYPDYGGKDKIAGKRYIIDYIFADAAGEPFSVFVFMPPVYTWPYDYLFLTYAKEKYGVVPKSEKKGLAYMIIEMDGTKPWSYQGWLETVIKDGTPVWEKYIKQSDHMLQKRIF